MGWCRRPFFRKIARSFLTQKRFELCKDSICESFFGKSARELTIDQLVFLKWASFYASLNERSENRPSKELVENDYELDRWLDEEIKKKTKEF